MMRFIGHDTEDKVSFGFTSERNKFYNVFKRKVWYYQQ